MLFFVALFFATAPVLIFFAQGYRFDSVSNIFVHSGSLTVKSWPRDVDVYVDGKKRKKSNLNVINNSYTVNGIRPGSHLVTCKKDGYTAWSKEVEVHSGISTEFWNIILFPVEGREISTFRPTETLDQFFISPREDTEIVYFSHNENKRYVSLLNTKDNSSEIIFETDQLNFVDPGKEENIEWSSDNKRILIPFQKDNELVYIIARIKKENLQDIINLNELFSKAKNSNMPDETTAQKQKTGANQKEVMKSTNVSFRKARWMFDKNDELVILTKDNELFYFDITNPEEKLLIDKQVNGFDFAGNRIYYSQLPNNIVWEIKNNEIATKRQITNVPIPENASEFLRLTVYDQYRIAIETANEHLYVYNEDKEDGKTSMYDLGTDIKGLQFSDDGKKIAYWTTNEIWCIFLREWKVQPTREKDDKIFITRFSRPIKNIQWMDDYENLLFTINGSVKSINIDTRWGTNTTDVYEQESSFEDRAVIYNKNNQTLYFTAQTNEGKRDFNSMLLIDRGFFGF